MQGDLAGISDPILWKPARISGCSGENPSLSLGAAGDIYVQWFWEVKPRISIQFSPLSPQHDGTEPPVAVRTTHAPGKSICREPAAPAWPETGQLFMEKGNRVGRALK